MNNKKYPVYAGLLSLLFCSAIVLAEQNATPKLDHDEKNTSQMQAATGGTLRYTGGSTRIGIGLDTEFKGRAELGHVFSEDDNSAISAEAWVGFDPSTDNPEREGLNGGGAKLNYHWVSRDAEGQAQHVNKVFGAVDQNVTEDRKVTVGYGMENEALFWDAHASKGISDKRQTENNTPAGNPIYEKAYDYGVGGRAGTFLDDSLVRVQGGVDYEWGTDEADNEDTPSQATLSVGVEKFFYNSPHSVAVNAETYSKSGGYEQGQSQTDTRANLMYRYEFGSAGVYRNDKKYKKVRVEIPGKPIPPKIKKKLVKHTMELEADTFFKLDSAKLTSAAQTRLNQVAAKLRDSGYEGNVRIVGNTCDLGSTKYNQKLSEKRASSVKQYLVSKGFSTNELISIGFGETKPKYPNTEETRHRNRRVDIEYVTYEQEVKEEVIAAGKRGEPRVIWRKELVPTEPAWVRRALHNPVNHKKTVDTYQTLAGISGTAANTTDNAAPVLANDTATVNENSQNNTIPVMANDSDPENDPMTIIGVSNPSNGNAGIDPNNGTQVIYTPNPDFSGTDSFTYSVQDTSGNVATATVTVTVNPENGGGTNGGGSINSVPVAANDQATTNKNQDVIIDVLLNDTDPDGDKLKVFEITQQPSNGRAETDGEEVEYIPNTDFVGVDSFVYTATDGGAKVSATVTVTVLDDSTGTNNTAPNANNDTSTTTTNTPVLINVTNNDNDPDGNSIVVSSVTQPSNGELVISADGQSIQYTPVDDFTGNDSFTYTITDGSLTATATVTVTVTPGNGNNGSNNPPIAVNDFGETFANTPLNLSILSNDSDPDGDTLTIVSTTQPFHGTVTINSNGTVTYIPRHNYCGDDGFQYTITDGNGGTATASVQLEVGLSENDPLHGRLPVQ